MNPRVTRKEHALIKGSLRRVFSRSEIRNKVINSTIIQGHFNPRRPRVETWCLCPVCGIPEAKSYMVADHIAPVVAITETVHELDANTLVDRLWCEENNLQAMCPKCHDSKTAQERQARKAYKKENKNEFKSSEGSKKAIKTNSRGNSTRNHRTKAI